MIIKLEIAISLRITSINVHSDSQLIVNQIIGSHKILKPIFIQYHKYIISLSIKIHEVAIYNFPKSKNVMANALAKFVKELTCLTVESIFIIV